MTSREARICVTLFVPGAPRDPKDALRASGLPFKPEAEWIENDGSFGKAFSFGTATAAQRHAIDAVEGAQVFYLPVELHTERARIAKFALALAEEGALAVRVEESKLGWPIQDWAKLVGGSDPWSLYRAVVVVLDDADGKGVGTCGMQVFSLPDAQVALRDRSEANELLGAFNVFQLAEDPVLRSGETFRPSKDEPRRVLHRWPDARYPAGHACHNPFGVWRLGAAGSKSEPPSELVFVFMPSLAATLMAAEKEAGRPLTRKQVESLRDKSPCVAMEPRDAKVLERSRGYVDLEPERAWEQWQITRAQSSVE